LFNNVVQSAGRH